MTRKMFDDVMKEVDASNIRMSKMNRAQRKALGDKARRLRPTDTQIVDFIASLWDSQGGGGRILSRLIPNPTGSFRDGKAAAMPNEKS